MALRVFILALDGLNDQLQDSAALFPVLTGGSLGESTAGLLVMRREVPARVQNNTPVGRPVASL